MHGFLSLLINLNKNIYSKIKKAIRYRITKRTNTLGLVNKEQFMMQAVYSNTLNIRWISVEISLIVAKVIGIITALGIKTQ